MKVIRAIKFQMRKALGDYVKFMKIYPKKSNRERKKLWRKGN